MPLHRPLHLQNAPGTMVRYFRLIRNLHEIICVFAALSAAGALTGGISTAVKIANERKAQIQAQKELEICHKELEKQISGSCVIADFAEKFESLPDKARLLVGDMLSSIAQAGIKLTKRGNGLYFLINK